MCDLPPVVLVGATRGGTTGFSRYTRMLKRALHSLGVRVSLAAPKPPPFPGWVLSMALAVGLDARSFFSTYPLALPDVDGGNLLHLTNQSLSSALAFKANRACVLTVHDLAIMTHKHDPEIVGNMKPYDIVFDNLARRGLRRFRSVIASSKSTCQELVRYLDYPSERLHVVYLGVDHDLFQPSSVADDFHARYHLDPEARYLLYVGSEDRRKNLHRLIKAFASLASSFPEVQLLKVGAARFTRERDKLSRSIKECALEGRVRFLDQVPDNDLVAFYNLAEAFVFPSLYEGFGLPVLEAMACGTPVIVSKAASLPEVAGDAAILVDPYDEINIAGAILRVLSDSEQAKALGQKGLQRARMFTWERTARQVIDIYSRVWAGV